MDIKNETEEEQVLEDQGEVSEGFEELSSLAFKLGKKISLKNLSLKTIKSSEVMYVDPKDGTVILKTGGTTSKLSVGYPVVIDQNVYLVETKYQKKKVTLLRYASSYLNFPAYLGEKMKELS